MPVIGEDDGDRIEQLAAHAERNKDAWGRTLDDMTAMAEARSDEGWDTVVIMAGHTAPEPPEAGKSDRYGLVYVVPSNHAEEFLEVFEAGQFPLYEVYRATTETRVFLVTEILDPDIEAAIYIAGNYRRLDVKALLRTAHRTGKMYSHLQKLDKTYLGSFEHENYRKFFPKQELAAFES